MMEKCSSAMADQDKLGWTPLHYTAHYGAVEVVKLLPTSNKSIAYKKDNTGMAAFHIAAENGHVEIMEILKKKCPDICELLICNGQTALHIAVRSRKKHAVEYLLETPGSSNHLNRQDNDGNTPLHLATIEEDYMILLMLLNFGGVKGFVVNKDGLTAMDFIQSCNELEESQKSEIMSMLERIHGCPGLKRQLPKRNGQLQRFEERVGDAHLENLNEASKKEGLDYEKKLSGSFLKFLHPDSLNPDVTKSATEVDILLATVIATVTFAATCQVPGRYESDGPFVGLPVFRNKLSFVSFIFCDAVAFGLSSSTIALHFMASLARSRNGNFIFLLAAKFTTFFSIAAMVGTFLSAIFVLSGHSKGGFNVINAAALVCVVTFLCGPITAEMIKGYLSRVNNAIIRAFFTVATVGISLVLFLLKRFGTHVHHV